MYSLVSRVAIITQVLHCPCCQEVDFVKNGKTPQQKQRYQCREELCSGRIFIGRLCLSRSVQKSKITNCRHGT
ncbi:IS1/IS1595 family N-terminal zinc-binding domain-containing protein [Synechocystis sp. PCC 7509]|uniref:IS1/IS1595 family N-terminal zinc-binding domain-containing protein n=1 Tax=Synechocystis sp. PCC 7509 TaxID=927677 RepID=UPI0009072752